MGLSWQQGPLSTGAIGRFLVPEPLPKRLLYVELLRRRMRVRFGGTWIADSEDVLLLFESGHYPMAYFPEADVSPDTLQRSEHTTRHPDLGLTSWELGDLATADAALTRGLALAQALGDPYDEADLHNNQCLVLHARGEIRPALERALAGRPAVGGFPYLAETLRRAVVTRNLWFLPASQSLYLTKQGPVVFQDVPLVSGIVDEPRYEGAVAQKFFGKNDDG